MLKARSSVFAAILLSVSANAVALQPSTQASQNTNSGPGDETASQERAQPSEDIVVPGKKQSRLWFEAIEAFKAGRYAEAEEKLHTLEQRVELVARVEAIPLGGYTRDFIFTVDRVPDDAAAIVYVRGIAQARQGKLDEAADAMNETLRINPKFFDAYADFVLIQALRGRSNRGRWHVMRMSKLLAKCDYNCAEKRVRYERAKEVVYAEATPKQ